MGGLFGGGGSEGSSGGSSSNSQLEAYIQTHHSNALDAVWSNLLTGENPYESINAFDPSRHLTALFASLATYAQVLIDFSNAGIDITALTSALSAQLAATTAFDASTSWVTFLATIEAQLPDTGLTDAEITQAIGYIGDTAKSEIEAKVLPAFEGGMRDINAVNSSAFLVGEAVIYSELSKHIANATSTYKLETAKMALERAKMLSATADSMVSAALNKISALGNYANEIGKIWLSGISIKQTLTSMIVDSIRAAANIEKTFTDESNRLDVAENRWYLDKYAYMGNMLASVRGAIHSTSSGQQSPSVGSSDLGGVLSAISGGMGIASMFMK
jgi:hypothetical protein